MLAHLEVSTQKYHEGDLTVRCAFVVSAGEVVFKREYPDRDLRLSTKKALKIARALGCEREVREAIEAQARGKLERSAADRERAAESYARTLVAAGERDAEARQALEALGVA
jgi:hypothetical protein